MSDLVILILSQMAITMMAVSAVKSHITAIVLNLARGIDDSNDNLINEIRRGN